MPHIHTEPGQYDFTISAFIVRYVDDVPRILLHMHRKHHKLLPVGGHIELNESPWSALEHELQEEAGYELARLQVLQPRERIAIDRYERIRVIPVPIHINSHMIMEGHFHTDSSYALIADSEPTTLPHEDESQDLRWLTRNEVAELSHDVIYSNTQQTILSIFDVFLPNWHSVPAADYLGCPVR